MPPSLESRDRVGRLLARRRAAAKAADVSGAAKVGVFKGTEGAGRVLASVNEAERSLEYREGGPLKGKAKEAYRAGFESAMRDAGVAPSPSPARGTASSSSEMKKSTPRVAIPKLAIKGSPADLELHGGGGVTARVIVYSYHGVSRVRAEQCCSCSIVMLCYVKAATMQK